MRRTMKSLILLLFGLFAFSHGLASVKNNDVEVCNLDESLIKEIRSYEGIVRQITEASLNGKAKGQVWNELAVFVDKFGPRIAGSDTLEHAIDYMLNKSKNYKLDNVHTEPVTVPHWVRGNEEATLLQPRPSKLNILGLGGSIGTTKRGITAEVLVVETFEELEQKSHKVKGKIVVFVEKWESYGETVKYRSYAAVKAAKHGAVAALIKSVSPFSINSPHTGWQDYDDSVEKIPAASLTIEDAEMLLRMSKRGQKIKIHLKMEAKTLGTAESRNTIVEVTGKQNPNEFVLVSGHLDSWDVGNGAMDDGGGAFVSWYSIVLLKQLGLQPRRTVRAVLWTGEEEGLIGAFAYKKAHSVKDMVLLMESDEGTFNPQGIIFKGNSQAKCIMEEVAKLLAPLNATDLDFSNDVGSDIMVWADDLVPLAALKNQNEKYFWFHHSNGDTMTVEDPNVLDRCLALWASVSYIVADLSLKLPSQ